MIPLNRITFDPEIMGGKPCIRGMRVTVGMIVGLVASGHNKIDILKLYPYLEAEDIDEALTYAAWRVEEIDVPFVLESAEIKTLSALAGENRVSVNVGVCLPAQ